MLVHQSVCCPTFILLNISPKFHLTDLWNYRSKVFTWCCSQQLSPFMGFCCFCLFQFESNDTLYSSHYDGLVHIWSIDTKRIIHTVAAHASHTVLWLEFTQGCLITQGRNGSVKFWKRLESDWIEQGKISKMNLQVSSWKNYLINWERKGWKEVLTYCG